MSSPNSPLQQTDDEEDDLPTAPFWMTTFGDVMTLLVTFFVLLISMSEVRMEKFKDAISNFQRQPGILAGRNAVTSLDETTASNARSRDEQYEELLEELEQNGLEEKIQANLTDEGIHIVIADSLMFRTGEARLIEPSQTVLRMLADILNDEVESVVVEGHTDDRPIHTRRFPSNWELSTARAASSVRFLQENAPGYDPSRFKAVGYASNQPRASNETSEGRARNRRVEIMLKWRQWNSEKTTRQKILPEP